MTDRIFSDEELTAFLDGEVDQETELAIAEAMETDESLGERIASLDVPLAQIRASYDLLLDDAPAMPALPEPRAPARSNVLAFSTGFFGVGLAAGLAVAVFTGLGQQPPPKPGWKAQVANYQLLYGKETLTGVEPSPQEAQLQMASVGEALDLDLSTLPVPAGMTFRRAQVLDFNGKALAQISYTLPDGTPVALCILGSGNPATPEMQMAAVQGLGSVSWNTGAHAYFLIGGEQSEELAPSARAFKTWTDTAT